MLPSVQISVLISLDASLTIDALVDVSGPGASMDALLVRKAELIVARAEQWQQEQDGRPAELEEAPEGPVRA